MAAPVTLAEAKLFLRVEHDAEDRLIQTLIEAAQARVPLICRAGPAGAAPGGAGFAEAGFTMAGLHGRPWAPSGLRLEETGDGLALAWTPRVRLYGDSWEGEPAAVDPLRFRLRMTDGDRAARTMEVEGARAYYPAEAMQADFPHGMGRARIAISQWGEAFGWGVEAEIALSRRLWRGRPFATAGAWLN